MAATSSSSRQCRWAVGYFLQILQNDGNKGKYKDASATVAFEAWLVTYSTHELNAKGKVAKQSTICRFTSPPRAKFYDDPKSDAAILIAYMLSYWKCKAINLYQNELGKLQKSVPLYTKLLPVETWRLIPLHQKNCILQGAFIQEGRKKTSALSKRH